MGIDNLTEKLSSMQDAWDKAPIGSEVPEGEYDATVDDIDFFEGKDGSLYLKIIFKIELGEYAGQTVDMIQSLSHEERLPFAKEALSKLGMDVEPLDLGGEFIERLKLLGGARVRISVVIASKGGRTFTNVYVRERMFDAQDADMTPDTSDLDPRQTSLDDSGDEKPIPF